MKTKGMFGCVLAALAAVGAATAQERAAESQADRDARMHWWREARFGMFIHWGLYAIPAGEWNGKPIGGLGEWIMNRGKIPIADYEKLAAQFNPVKYDADAWVRAAKDAGMKYIVITSKHHDGFALFKTAASPFNVVDATPYKKDPLKDLVAACRRHDMRIGFYYSQNLDWHHPGGGGGEWDPTHQGDPEAYVRNIAGPQVREILSNYGRIDVLWWDIPGGVINKERADRLYGIVKELQPAIVMNNRLGGGYAGDTETPEQRIPPNGYPGRDWETCMTMNDTWGFKKNDHNWKPVTSLIRNLCDIASKGGNYLLNVGPTAGGEIPAPSLERLAEIGVWMKQNGDAIYGTSASPFPEKLPWGRVTQKGARLYLIVFDPPADRALRLPGLKTAVTRAYRLADADRNALETGADEGGVKVMLPEGFTPTPHATVIVAELEGAPEVTAVPKPAPAPIKPAADGTLALKAAAAVIVGGRAKLEDDHIGFWLDAQDHVKWTVTLEKPGAYRVGLDYACPENSSGSDIEVAVGGARVTGRVTATGEGWRTFKRVDLGRVEVEKPGTMDVTVKATRKPGLAVMNLRTLVLTPVETGTAP